MLKDLSNDVADAIGATRTPEVFVLDNDHVVRYSGRIDDRFGVGYMRDKVDHDYLALALDARAGRQERSRRPTSTRWAA